MKWLRHATSSVQHATLHYKACIFISILILCLIIIKSRQALFHLPRGILSDWYISLVQTGNNVDIYISCGAMITSLLHYWHKLNQFVLLPHNTANLRIELVHLVSVMKRKTTCHTTCKEQIQNFVHGKMKKKDQYFNWKVHYCCRNML